MKKNFDEGFDNILTLDYDGEYTAGVLITSEALVTKAGKHVTSLAGEWNFSPDVFNSVVRSRWFDEVKCNRDNLPIPYDYSFENWEKVRVPGVWNNQKKEFTLYEGVGLYFKEFAYERKESGKVFLRFDGANYETRVWLNKKYLGRHLGGFTPFCMDITDSLEERNRLLVSVDNTRKKEQIPSLHYDWFNYGGIHRDVEILEAPSSFIKDVYIQLSKEHKNQLEYEVTIESADTALEEAVIQIEELGISESISCQKQPDTNLHISRGKIFLDEEKIVLWSPKYPKLYEVKVESEQDFFGDRIGFRRIETVGQEIFLNGENIFLKGMCVHEESQEHGRVVKEEEIVHTIKQAKELGCNFLRLTHYPHSELVSKTADQLGVLLLEEIPVYWAIEFENPQTFQDAKNQLQELILRDRNRASVIIWSIGNENPDSDCRYQFMSDLAETVREIDGSRLLGASCLIDVNECRIKDRLMDKLDVIGINEYYGWYLRKFEELEEILSNSKIGKPLIITETGADAVSGFRSDTQEFYSEEYQAEVYRKQFEIIGKFSCIRGITPWILYDYASMRRMSVLQNGYNLKGIIDKDKTYKKMAYYVVKEMYGRL